MTHNPTLQERLELSENDPYLMCSACGRKSWSLSAAGQRCGITQPDGRACDGILADSGSEMDRSDG